MHNHPTPPERAGDEFAGNPVIEEAERQLRSFGGHHIDRDRAVRLLHDWVHNPELTDQEREAVLSRFGPPPGGQPYRSDTPYDGWRLTGRATAVCGHCGQPVPVLGGRFTLHTRGEGDHCRDSGRPVPAGAMTLEQANQPSPIALEIENEILAEMGDES